MYFWAIISTAIREIFFSTIGDRLRHIENTSETSQRLRDHIPVSISIDGESGGSEPPTLYRLFLMIFPSISYRRGTTLPDFIFQISIVICLRRISVRYMNYTAHTRYTGMRRVLF